MAQCTGWILDVSIEQNRAVIWIKTTKTNILRLVDKYHPNFYVLPANEFTASSLFHRLSDDPVVANVECAQKYTDLFDTANHGLRRLISVYTKSTHALNTLIKRLEKDTHVAQLFDTDLSPVQQYLFKTLKIEPSSKVDVEYDDNTFRLIGITNIEEAKCAPPPFSILYFDVHHDFDSNRIRQIKARCQDESYISFEGEEENVKEFHEFVANKDPDILIFTGDTFKHFITKMNALGFDMGRESNNVSVKGRVLLESKSFHTDLDLAGLIERARLGFLPLGLAAHYGINRLIDSRNCYTLIQKGFQPATIACTNQFVPWKKSMPKIKRG